MIHEKEYDVAVIGAGVAGIAAAVQASREGKKTVLIEKTVLPGGLATTGLIYVYLPLCDGNGHQVSFGITEELLRMSIQYGPGRIPDWRKAENGEERERFIAIFSPASFQLALDEYLVRNQVDIWYDTLVCDAETADGKIRAVFCENESGRIRIKAKCFVDASGSAVLARRAGIPCSSEEVNYLSIWAIQYDKRFSDRETELGTPLHMHAMGIPWDASKAPEGTLFRGANGKGVTDYVLKSRKFLLDYYKKTYAEENLTRNDVFPVVLPAMAQFRKIYAVDSLYNLNSGENNRRFEDSIGLVSDWRKAGPVWEIPYRSLCPACRTGGYLSAGRCIGSVGDAWEVTRVIPPAALTGQAAGMAASLSIDSGVEPFELDPALLQKKLAAAGFPLHLPDVGLAYE